MAHVVTIKSNMVVPEVLAGALEVKMINYIKISKLARINRDLVANSGDTITIPYWNYIGDAADLAENTVGEAAGLSAATLTATVKKAFKAVEITDEAMLSSFGSPMNEIERQMALAMASKVEEDCFTVLEASTNICDMTLSPNYAISTDSISYAVINRFGEDFEGVYLFVTPAQYHTIRTSDDFVHIANGAAVISGHVGEVHGVQIVVSSRADATKNVMLKEGGLQISLKREVEVEVDRNILKKTTIISADRHYVAHIYDATKVAVAKFGTGV